MSGTTGTTLEIFKTEEEATAFTEGLEYADNDHLFWEPPYEQNGDWIVEIRQVV